MFYFFCVGEEEGDEGSLACFFLQAVVSNGETNETKRNETFLLGVSRFADKHF